MSTETDYFGIVFDDFIDGRIYFPDDFHLLLLIKKQIFKKQVCILKEI